jgi:hypothetical protein
MGICEVFEFPRGFSSNPAFGQIMQEEDIDASRAAVGCGAVGLMLTKV